MTYITTNGFKANSPNRQVDEYSFGWGERKRKYVDLIQDTVKIQRQKDIYHHGPYHITITCHLLDPLDFSLPTTLKEYTEPRARPVWKKYLAAYPVKLYRTG